MADYIGISKPLAIVRTRTKPKSEINYFYGPWESIDEALNNIPQLARIKGITVGIIFFEEAVETVKEYWWKKGTEDTDLELKIDNAAPTKTSQLENDTDFQNGNQVSAGLQEQKNILDAVDINLQGQINIHSSQIKDIVTAYIDNKGYFATLESLQASYPTPEIGDTAYVADALSSIYYIYNVVDGIWTSSTVEAPPVAVPIQGGIYDVSVHNNNAIFESLQSLLSNPNLSSLIPISARCGGMSIRFINFNNRYVQYRYTGIETIGYPFSDNANWQCIDCEIIFESTEVIEFILPNVLNKWGNVRSLTINIFQGAQEGYVNEYMLEFTVSGDDFTLTLPEGVRWIEEPTWENGYTYQVSIVNNLAVFAGWEAQTNE